MTTTPRASRHPEEMPPNVAAERGAGWRPETAGGTEGIPVFAAVVFVTVGILQIFQGISAFVTNTIYVTTENYWFAFNMTNWGWAHLIVGALAVVTGAALLTGANWARWTGVVLAGLSILANFLWLPYYPLWALVVIALDVFVIWSLTARTTMGRMAHRA